MSSPEDDDLRAVFDQAHGPAAPPPFRTLLAQPPRPRRTAGRLTALVAIPALALALAIGSTLLPRSRAPLATSIAQGELARLSDLCGPLDFLLEPPASDGLAGLPSFDLPTPSPQPTELTRGLRP